MGDRSYRNNMKTVLDVHLEALINAYRIQNDLDPVAFNKSLDKAAQRHTNDMAEKDFFGYTGSDGSTFLTRLYDVEYNPIAGSQLIGVGLNSAQEIFDGMEEAYSPFLLDEDVKELGIGYTYLENDTEEVNFNYYSSLIFADDGGDDPVLPQVFDSSDIIQGPESDDFFITAGQWKLNLGLGNDIGVVKPGDRTPVYGQSGDDIILGNEVDNYLSGDKGDDILWGGKRGFDWLKGGTDSDKFVIGLQKDRTTIIDFKSGEDSIILENGLEYSDLEIVPKWGYLSVTANGYDGELRFTNGLTKLTEDDVLIAHETSV